jgi:hypothetical protein
MSRTWLAPRRRQLASLASLQPLASPLQHGQSTSVASVRLPNKVLQQTGLSLAYGSLWRPQLNTGTLGRPRDLRRLND